MKKETVRESHQITCLACFNLVMCGRDIRNKVHVKCCQDVLDHGRLILLEDVIDKKYGERGCALFDKAREKPLPGERIDTWRDYIQELRKNFCTE